MILETKNGYAIIRSHKLAMVLSYMLKVKYKEEINNIGKYNYLFEDNKEFRDMLDVILKYKKHY